MQGVSGTPQEAAVSCSLEQNERFKKDSKRRRVRMPAGTENSKKENVNGKAGGIVVWFEYLWWKMMKD
jgi:hypothetical protein